MTNLEPGGQDLSSLSDALRTQFQDMVLPRFETRVTEVRVLGLGSLTFNAAVETTDLCRFDVVLHDGCVALLYRALDVPAKAPLAQVTEVATMLFGDMSHHPLVSRAIVRLAVMFVLLHEFAHAAAGHLHALRALPRTASDRSLRFDEVPASAPDMRWRVSARGLPRRALNKIFELEADATAFGLLVDTTFDVLVADAETCDQLGPGQTRETLTAEQGRALDRLAFFACSLAVSLTERKREEALCESDYPPAVARMMSLCLVLLRRRLPGDWSEEDGFQTVEITAEGEEAVREILGPAMAQAVTLCEACCRNAGLGLGAGNARASPPTDLRLRFAQDIGLLALGRTRQLTTRFGRELNALMLARLHILDQMKPLRQAAWWDKS